MKRYALFCIIILASVFLITFSDTALAISWRTDLEGALRSAEKSDDLIMVDFYTDWCHWCKKLDDDTYSDGRVNKLARGFICVKINADDDKRTAQKYNVRGFPTIIFLNSKGVQLGVIAGYLPPEDFADRMEALLKNFEASKEKAPASKKTDAAPAAEKETPKKRDFKADMREFKNKAIRRVEKMRNYNLELNGILFDPKTPKAIINDKIVKVGDTIEGAKVLSIGKETVELQLKEKKLSLKLQQ